MTSRAFTTTIEILAGGCLVIGIASLGLFTGEGTAAADGHNVVDVDATWGAPDGAEQRGASWHPAVQAADMSADILPTSPGTPSWPAPPSWGTYPKPSSYPAAPAWPGAGWGIPDD